MLKVCKKCVKMSTGDYKMNKNEMILKLVQAVLQANEKGKSLTVEISKVGGVQVRDIAKGGKNILSDYEYRFLYLDDWFSGKFEEVYNNIMSEIEI